MRNRRARQGLSTVLAVVALAGLLIWTKLRLVSDLPRSAYAVPNLIDAGEGEGEPRSVGASEGEPPQVAAPDEKISD